MLRKAGLYPQSTNYTRAPEGPSHPDEIEGYISLLRYILDKALTCICVRPSIPGSPVQMTPEYVLNPLAIFRMARRTVHEKHAPEESTSPISSTASNRQTQVSQPPQDIDYNTRPLPIHGSSANHTQQNDLPYHQGKPFHRRIRILVYLSGNQAPNITSTDLKFSPDLNLADRGSQRKLQWTVPYGVDYRRGLRAPWGPLGQIQLWRAISISNRHFILNFNNFPHPKVSLL